MKLGLVLAYKGVNYGMLLQAYATQRVLETMNYETEIIDYTRVGFKHIRLTPWLPVYFASEIIKKYKNKKNKPDLDAIHQQNIRDRKIVSKKFIENNLLNRVKCCGIEELEKHTANSYNGVLIGFSTIPLPIENIMNFPADSKTLLLITHNKHCNKCTNTCGSN